MIYVAFVCTGNTCRSAMSEYILKDKLEKENNKNISVFSCGTAAYDGMMASRHTIQVCRENGIDISAHKARLISNSLKIARLVLCMEPHHADALSGLVCCHLLTAWPNLDLPSDSGIPDPYNRDIYAYRHTFASIKKEIDRIYPHLINYK